MESELAEVSNPLRKAFKWRLKIRHERGTCKILLNLSPWLWQVGKRKSEEHI